MAFNSLRDALPAKNENISTDDLLSRFLDWVETRNITLYEAQENAILELFDGKNVILNTPTGSGKSLVALALHFESLARGRRSVYTCPIKALVNEKWMALCREFGPENVGLSTGDATVNKDAPILCCTAEILANRALGEGDKLPIEDVVMDEFHYYSDRERGVAWQVPLLTLPQSRFLLMSATIGATAFFESELEKHTGKPAVTVRSTQRPVPLEFSYSTDELSNAVQKLVSGGKSPVYVVHFTQMSAAQDAQNFTSLELCTKEEKTEIAKAIAEFRFSSPYGPDIKRWLKQGIGLHHAGLLPKYRILTERLAQKGLLKVICGTDTLGVGVNVPIRTVLFTQLCKYSGDKTAILTARDFHQVAGRAGRKGFDDIGYVVAQAPAHVIENAKLAAKSEQSGRKFVKRQPPEHGFVPWDANTFNRLIEAQPEPLTSSFQVSHGMLLNVLSRPTDGCRAMRTLIADCHESAKRKKELKTRAFQLFRSLVESGIIGFVKPAAPGMAKLRVNVNLQDDFSMNEPLSLFLLDAVQKLDAQNADYALDLLSLVESIIEDPDIILRKQLECAKDARMAELKAEGVEYDRRMDELDKVEYPKPLSEFIYNAFDEFRERHPWVEKDNVHPKSIVREMFEKYSTFSGYIKDYGIQRSEGILLRHVNNVYKVLMQTVPDSAKTEEVRDMESYLGEMLRRVDSSLLEEWERLKNPEFKAAETSEAEAFGKDKLEEDVTRDHKAFLGLVRARIFSLLGMVRAHRYGEALDLLAEDLPEGTALTDVAGVPWTENRLADAFAEYVREYGEFRLDAEGRALRYTVAEWTDSSLRVQQLLQDNESFNDWEFSFEIPLAESRAADAPLLRLLNVGPVA